MYKAITAAGTFDHFHQGHQTFLRHAFQLAQTVYLGITGDAFVRNTKPTEEIQSFALRRTAIEDFLSANHLLSRAKLFELTTPFGPAIEKNCPFEAILVTSDTLSTAKEINQQRYTQGLSPLSIETTTLLSSEDGKVLSSTRIRQGEVDRNGKVYINPKFLSQTATLPKQLRTQLQTPFGTLYHGTENNYATAIERIQIKNLTSPIITVGDIVTAAFKQANIPITIAIIDFKTQRKSLYTDITELGFRENTPVIHVENIAGTISAQLTTALSSTLAKKSQETVIQVTGEEDLATIVAVLAAPLGSCIYYGQAKQGVVEILVTEEIKQLFREIYNQFAVE
jgi:cytidyltransferase-like protein